MLLLGFIFLLVALTAGTLVGTENYILTIDNNTLKNIRVTGKTPDDLDLSNLDLISIDENVFANLSNLKTLNLANNALKWLPQFVFANLTNLEHLNLANNSIIGGHIFGDLSSLKTLNISYNPLSSFESDAFFGLSNSTNILTQGVHIRYIRTSTFEPGPINNSWTPLMYEMKELEEKASKLPEENATKLLEEYEHKQFVELLKVIVEASANDIQVLNANQSSYKNAKQPVAAKTNDDHILNPSTISDSVNQDTEPGIKVCIQNGHLKLLEDSKKGETLSKDCHEVTVKDGCSCLLSSNKCGALHLTGLGIRTFESGWCRQLQNYDEIDLHLEDNNITKITNQLLNDLPPQIKCVNLKGNDIERLERRVIENKNPIHVLDLSYNHIIEIEDGALEKLNLVYKLRLNHNQLKNTTFLDSLPLNITSVDLNDNKITEISSGDFSKLSKIVWLNLDSNKIAKAKRLRGLRSLRFLTLNNNTLRDIEPGFFHDLTSLNLLYLSNNNLSSIEQGAFSRFNQTTIIDLSCNAFTEIPSGVFSDLPDTLSTLNLDNNQIEILKTGAFVLKELDTLSLEGNKISKIEKGSFDISSLNELNLKNNYLEEMDGDSFEGLNNLRRLLLASNRITTIKKKAAKNLNGLTFLDLSHNPIKRLENGALFGLTKSEDFRIQLEDVPLEVVQGGLFDDV